MVNKDDEDVTAQFRLCAEKVLALVKEHHITAAVLKESSPSCGSSTVYDGTFSGIKIPGSGITASLLMENGVRVYSEKSATLEMLEENQRSLGYK